MGLLKTVFEVNLGLFGGSAPGKDKQGDGAIRAKGCVPQRGVVEISDLTRTHLDLKAREDAVDVRHPGFRRFDSVGELDADVDSRYGEDLGWSFQSESRINLALVNIVCGLTTIAYSA
jgi:hypothetical protein